MAGPNFGLLDNALVSKNRALEGFGAVNTLISQVQQNQADKMAIENALAEKAAYEQAGGDVTAAQKNLMAVGRGEQAVKLGKAVAETEQAKMKTLSERLPIQRDMAKDMAFNPSDENILAHLQDQMIKGWISPQEAQTRWQRVAGMPPEQRKQFFLQGATKAEDLLQQQTRVEERTRGTVPAGYRMTPEGNLEAIPGGPTTTPIAPKDLQKREAAFPQAKASVAGYESKADKFVRDIDELLENKDGLDEITGYLAGRTELSAISPSGRKALAKYNQITAKGGFQALQDIREMSKTGGALGNVSNQEGKQLVASFAAIDRRQSADDVRAALEQVKSDIEGSKARIRETFDETYAYKQGGGAATGGAPVTGNSPAAQALARFRASKGQ